VLPPPKLAPRLLPSQLELGLLPPRLPSTKPSLALPGLQETRESCA